MDHIQCYYTVFFVFFISSQCVGVVVVSQCRGMIQWTPKLTPMVTVSKQEQPGQLSIHVGNYSTYTWTQTLATAIYCYRPHLSSSKACTESVRGLDNCYNTCSQLQQHLVAFSTGYGPRPLTARELLQCFWLAGHFGQSRLDLDAFFGHWLKRQFWDLDTFLAIG